MITKERIELLKRNVLTQLTTFTPREQLEVLELARWAIETAKPALEDIIEMEEHCSTDTRKSFLQEDCERALAAFPADRGKP